MPNYSYTKEQLQEAVDQSSSIHQALKRLGLVGKGRAYTSFRRGAKYFDVDISRLETTCKKYTTKTIDRERLAQAVIKSQSIRSVIRYLGYDPNTNGSFHTKLKRIIKEMNLDTSHFTGQGWNKGRKYGPKHPVEDYLSNRRTIQSSKLKGRLLYENIFQPQCQDCNNKTWMGQPIPLELHHIDGNHLNNSLNNLRLLCPNCHAFTSNYRRSNYKIEVIQ